MSNQPNKTNGAKPAVRKKKNLLDDRRVRLALSVLGAIVAWMVVTIIVQPGTTNTIYNVPVDYTYDSAAYTSRGLSIVSAEDKTVNLKLSGDGYTIGGLSASDFVVYPDWSSVRDSGEKTLRLLVRGANGLLNGVTVTMEGSDNTVDVVFDVVEEKTLPVTATTNYLRIADGYILYSTEVSKETVTLSGPSSELSKVATCTAEASYDSELTESVTLDTPLRFYTSGGKEVKFQYTTLEESNVDVTLQVYKTATLPVKVNFINAPRGFDNSVLSYAYNYTASNIIREEQKQQLIREIIEDMPVEPDNVSEFVNDVLSEILSEALVAVGGPKFDDADRELAKKFFDLYTPSEIEAALKRLSYNYENWEDYRTIPLVEEVGPYKKTSAYGFGSTDVGDASYAAPTAQMNVATYANGTPGHSWNVTAQVNSSITHKALVTVAEALSLACILTIERPEAVKAAREEYIKSTGGKYICPVGMDAKPELEHV